ncbi:hypothetical protein [Bacteroides graminisolvens]|uniref:hypothetical protein n=1 Tax=Bacteroides graminisolvens TaxID=477666 RepID=UPI00240A43A5|nr:hypothetical protein [Bacteroides graminisolvens]
MRERKHMTIDEASKTYDVDRMTIYQRLFQDKKRGKQLHGCFKVGESWVITDEYMENRKWRKKNV